MNYASHARTAQFVGMMSLMTRPTRVTATSATLTDDIFTNYLEDISHSILWLFITDVSDHFPIFPVSRIIQMMLIFIYAEGYIHSLRNKEEFCHAISTNNWNEINHGKRATDTQWAFDVFDNRLTELYNKYFPKVMINKKYNNRKPWLCESRSKCEWFHSLTEFIDNNPQ